MFNRKKRVNRLSKLSKNSKKRIEDVAAYQVLTKKELKELKSTGYLCRHKKTGARVVLLCNEEENKVFSIGFRTTPRESTGVSHILEHSVLCGSKNFPVKDPFIELAKGSLNTFLNAMTYPDKTVYPVASCNDKDFDNLMHVYLDAVFYPNIYDHDMTFRQEGWHYEMEDADGDLTINGVVYNEMKGAFSSPDDVLEREIMNSLFPDNAYSEESGGDPDRIPELTYEHFLEIHRTYYHPSNSYIYLYGNMDMAEKLQFIDEQYLSAFEAIQIDSKLTPQEAFREPVEVIKEYSVAEGEPLRANTYLSYNTAMRDNLNREHYLAFQVLDYALCSAPGAPLKQALLDAGIGKDVYSYYENGVLQPYFSIVSKNADLEQKEEFVHLIRETLEELCLKGLDRKALKAGLNYYEFKYREGDFGSYPPGLMYGLQIMDSWLYDDANPFLHVESDDTFESLRSKIETGYYEELIREFLLNNPHKTMVCVKPVENLALHKEEALHARLQQYKASLSREERERIVEETKALRAYQEQENTPEEMACIPILQRADIKKETGRLYNEEGLLGDVPILYHDVFTNKISYFRVMFQADGIPLKLLGYLGMMKSMLGYVDTEKYSYSELFNEINIRTGGMTSVINLYTDSKDLSNCRVFLEWKVKTLEHQLESAFALSDEILLHSQFTDDKRLYEIIAEMKSRMQSSMTQAGHQVAMTRAASYFSTSAAVSDEINGLPLYQLVDSIEKDFENKKEELKASLKEVCRYLFRKENLRYDFTGSRTSYEVFTRLAEGWEEKLCSLPMSEAPYRVTPCRKNEGFVTAGQVQYVARAGNFTEKGLTYTGALRALRVIMGYDYLWNRVRVKGGAYGCMCNFGKNGDSYFVSYRDPNLEKTLQVFLGAVEYIRSFDVDERTMTQYIIGAVSDLDTPLTPAGKGLRSLTAYMTNQTEEDFQRERDQLLAATPEDIRGLADHVEAFLDQDCVCVVGTRNKIEENREVFDKIQNLF
ncbi:MAG: insulinase family protein [Lachnospiraceae bacterium]|nr:insulinase family protein [Lachnospiraceae bacterium]